MKIARGLCYASGGGTVFLEPEAAPDAPILLSIHHVTTGVYDIVFPHGHFTQPPTIVVTPAYNGGYGAADFGGDTRDNAVIVWVGKEKARIKTGSNNGKAEDKDFFFIAIGV